MGKHSVKSSLSLWQEFVRSRSVSGKQLVVACALIPAFIVSSPVLHSSDKESEVVVEESSGEEDAPVFSPQASVGAVGDFTGAPDVSVVGAKPAPSPESSPTPVPENESSSVGDEGTASVSKDKEGSSSGSSVLPRGVYSGGKPDSISYPECNVSSSIEAGLTDSAVRAYRAVCAEFPGISSYGGRRNDPGSDHHTGNAVDVMVRGETGDRITEFLIRNNKELRVKYVIWEQKLYAPYTGWKGRPMENRGGDTANHFDHVHISVN